MEISESILQKIRGNYVEARHSSVIYQDLRTQEGKEVQKEFKEGLFVRVVDRNRVKMAHSPGMEALDRIQSAKWHPVSTYTPPEPAHYTEEPPQPVELPVESVTSVVEFFKDIPAWARLESLTVYEHIITNRGTNVCCGNSKLFVRIFLTPVQGITLVYSFGYPGQDISKNLELLEECNVHKFSQWSAIDSGQYDVVLSPQVTGMLFHEVAHSFEGSHPAIQLPASISISDHPEAQRLGGYTYDSEGCRASETVLVAKGEIQGGLASVFEPGDTPPTGNGRASSFDFEPIPRQSNLEVTGGHSSEEELLEMVKNGVYIAQVGEGSTFPGGITYFANTVSYRIENGEKAELLKNINFGGNLLDIINNIEAMGSNEKVEPTVCWKNHQRLFVTTKAPSCLIRELPLVCHTSSKSSKRIM